MGLRKKIVLQVPTALMFRILQLLFSLRRFYFPAGGGLMWTVPRCGRMCVLLYLAQLNEELTTVVRTFSLRARCLPGIKSRGRGFGRLIFVVESHCAAALRREGGKRVHACVAKRQVHSRDVFASSRWAYGIAQKTIDALSTYLLT